jgi:3-oxoadipate enol-lactonase
MEPSAQVKTFTVATPRMHFHCRSWGEADGVPLLLLHSAFGSSRWWERFGALLPQEFHAVAPDLRGCGGSAQTTTGYAIDEQAADVAALAAALGWGDCHLIAHGSSGAIGMQLALDRPELLSTLTLVDSAPVEGVFTPLDAYLVLEQMRQDRALLRQAIALLMPSLPLESEDAANRALLDQLVDDAAGMAPAAFTEPARALSQWNQFSAARRLTLPTLLVWGDRDSIVDRDATTRTLLAIPGANNLEILRGVGHSPQIEAPQRLVDLFVDFVTQDFAGFDAVRSSV